jgi:hypothetical protein
MRPTRSSSGASAAGTPVWAWVGVLCLVALGAALRLRGIGYLLPTVTQLDGSVIVHQVETIRAGTSGAEDDQMAAYYPHLLARATALLPDPGRVGVGPARELAEHLKLASAQWVQARTVSVLLALLVVPGTFWLARRFLTSGWALLAAALCTTSLLHVVFSSQERPHGTATSFGLLAVIAAVRLRHSGRALDYLLAGAAAGLAIGSLHYGAFVLLSFVAAVVLRDRSTERTSVLQRLASSAIVAAKVLAALAIIAACIYWLYPFHFAGKKGFLSLQEVGGERALNLSGQPLFLEKFNGSGFASMVSNGWSYDPVLFVSAIAGVALFVWRSRQGWRWIERGQQKDLAVVLAHALPYFLVLGMYAETWERFLLPLVPYAACASAFAAKTVLEALSRRWHLDPAHTARVTLIGAVLPVLALIPAVEVGAARSAPSTLACAAAWIREHARVDDPIVVVPYVDLPLLHADEALAENSKRPWMSNWIRYQMKLEPAEKAGPRYELYVVPKPRLEALRALADDPMAYFRELGARYVVIEIGSGDEANLEHARAALQSECELVYRVTPERVDRGGSTAFFQRHLAGALTRPFFAFVFDAARMGPTLEIYRLK